MDWSQADPLVEIDGQIRRLEDDRRNWQHILDDAHSALVRAEHLADGARASGESAAQVRAEHLADGARAAEDSARTHVREDTAEIATLRSERRAIVPDPRHP